jgi:hypothetical protein
VSWVVASVALAFVGLLVIAYCGFKVFAAVRRLAGELERARRGLLPRQAALRDELEVLNRMTDQ